MIEYAGKFLLAIIEHVAGHNVNESLQSVINDLKKGGKPVNHDLQKAVRRSYFSSLQSIVTDCNNELRGEPPWEFTVGIGGKSYPVTLTKKPFKNIADIIAAKSGMKLCPLMVISPVYSEHRQELEWLDQEKNRLAITLGQVGQEKFSDKISEFIDEAEAMLNPSDDEAIKEKILYFKQKLTEEVLKDNNAPECFKKKVHETFFDLMRDHFFWEIKHNPLVFNIFVASELAKISQKSHPPSQGKITLDIDTISTPHLMGIIQELQERGNDITLKIRRIEQGTVTLVLEGSKEGLERLESLFKSGELTEILGVPVKDVSIEAAPSFEPKLSPDAGEEGIIEKATAWLSSLFWMPEGAGQPVTAADISEQEHEFIADEFGEIKIICYWDRQNQDDEDSAYIRVSWDANLTTESGLFIRFVNPETRQIYHEAPLGNIWTGEAVFESRILGFNPLKEKWGISIVISEAE